MRQRDRGPERERGKRKERERMDSMLIDVFVASEVILFSWPLLSLTRSLTWSVATPGCTGHTKPFDFRYPRGHVHVFVLKKRSLGLLLYIVFFCY